MSLAKALPRVSRPLKIGLLTTYFAVGKNSDSGIGQHYRILADSLAEQGHQVHVVYATAKPENAVADLAALAPRWTCEIVPIRTIRWLDRLLKSSWPSRVLLTDLLAALSADRALRRAVKKHRLEVIETHATNSPALVYLWRRTRPPVITRVSTSMSQMNATSANHSRVKEWQSAIERYAVRSSEALLTHTIKHRDALCRLDGYKPESFAIIPHGLPDIPHSTAPVSTNLRLEILFVGRFERRKGIDVLLAAIPDILAQYPNACLTLAGSTGNGQEWDRFAREHPDLAGTRVVSLGRVSTTTLENLYARCDILVAPSRYESFGLVYVEAMRCAKPVIGCLAGGIPEVVTDGVTGLLAKAGDVTSLTECLQCLLDNPGLRTRLGQAGRAEFLRLFSANEMASRSAALYSAILTTRTLSCKT